MDEDVLKPLWRLYRNSFGNSIDFDDYVAVVTRLQALRSKHRNFIKASNKSHV